MTSRVSFLSIAGNPIDDGWVARIDPLTRSLGRAVP